MAPERFPNCKDIIEIQDFITASQLSKFQYRKDGSVYSYMRLANNDFILIDIGNSQRATIIKQNEIIHIIANILSEHIEILYL